MHAGAYGESLISQPATMGSHSSSSPIRVRMSRVFPWPRSPEQHEVVAGEEGALQLGQHGVVESDDAGKAVLATSHAVEHVLADLGLHGPIAVAARRQVTEGGGLHTATVRRVSEAGTHLVSGRNAAMTAPRSDTRPGDNGRMRFGESLVAGDDLVAAATQAATEAVAATR